MGHPSVLSQVAPPATGYKMINSIQISNFRCYEHVEVDHVGRLNVIVGDNGAGKTALLEAIFLALGSSPELSVRYRSHRGLDPNMNGSVQALERALWKDMFYMGNMDRPIYIKLNGSGDEKRSVRISQNVPRTKLVAIKDSSQHLAGVQVDDSGSGLRFNWVDGRGKKHDQLVTFTAQGISVQFLEGSLPEKPDEKFFYISAMGHISASENASRFSELNMSGHKGVFLDVFRREYPWIEDLSLEMSGGQAVLFAKVNKPLPSMRPLALVSGGINRVLSILLCIATARGGVVLVDEIDNGVHHDHQAAVWRMLLELCGVFNTQLIMTTHSNEWLRALVAAGKGKEDDVSLWRIRQGEHGVAVKQFGGRQAFIAIESEVEVR